MRVDVNVAGAAAEGLEQDHVHEADDGGLAGELEEVGGLADGAGCAGDGALVERHFLDDFGNEVLALFVAAVDEVGDACAGREDDLEGLAEDFLEHVEDRGLHGLRGGDGHDVAVGLEACDELAAGDIGGDEFVEALGGLLLARLGDEGEARALGEEFEAGVFVDGERAEEDVPGLFIGAVGGDEALEEFGGEFEGAEEIGHLGELTGC